MKQMVQAQTPVLVDTSIWIEHFRSENRELRALLEADRVLMHPFVVAELALGGLRDRMMTLALLDELPELPVAELSEIRELIEVQKLYTEGIGLVDAQLIAALILSQTPAEQWTDDLGLARVAEKLGFLAIPPFSI